MPTVEQLRSRLIEKLKELFQLDQPDLDFGFYRIMHAKAEQVTKFLEDDLLKIVDEAFGDADGERLAGLKKAYEEAIQQAKEFDAENPEETGPVKKAKAALDAAKDTSKAEGEVYDHLYRFFERYYDSGDFISRRYYTRETESKAAPYAIPYKGEEVKLHWANADQYYIKTTEHFNNFTFDIRAGARKQAELNKKNKEQIEAELPLDDLEGEPLRVHFRVVEATEGEHGNVKASEQTKRYFIINKNEPVLMTEDGELVCQFEFRPDPEKTGQDKTWREKRNEESVRTIQETLAIIAKNDKTAKRYQAFLLSPAPTDKQKVRPLLAKYVNKYTARNTMDYFIHKDLGGFLRRELDFYIKNEVMRLDDIDSADSPAVESYLAKFKVLRGIAREMIDFLAQLEGFQKKLWLKKKFVVQADYCITLDLIPEEFYSEIAACDEQRREWVRLFSINSIQEDLSTPGYSEPLTVEFIKEHQRLVVDTALLPLDLKDRIIDGIADNLDDTVTGLLIHSENFQALQLLSRRYRNGVPCCYIDPPFNIGEQADYLYRVDYKDATWIGLLDDRIKSMKTLLAKDGSMMVRCNHDGNMYVRLLMASIFGDDNYRNEIIVRRAEESKGDLNRQFAGTRSITVNYDNLYWFSVSPETRFGRFMKETSEKQSKAHWHSFWKAEDRPNLRYEILGIDLRNHYGQWMWSKERAYRAVENFKTFEKEKKKTGESLEDYWQRTGQELEFICRTGDGYSSIK